MPPPFIYINGYPGVGKLTIAKLLSNRIENSKVVDNHLLIDPVASVFDRSMNEYQPLRKLVRTNILYSIAASTSTKDVTWIFTDQQSSSAQGSSAAQDYQNAATAKKSRFISVILNCGLDENIKRLRESGRGGSVNTKLTNVAILRSIRENEDLYSFGGKDELQLDVSNLSAPQAVDLILDHLGTTQKIFVC
ncbi:hypothetical protein FGG08_003737 [Glutinoglossum americanum]|uniref:Uncharacterized protein n=1 Tax=Glutinoglossum americanum TaxID=1670608 RepID=A0A9P8HXM7_9PEZI|nr:hypothetical protein FGG08_003737 [Glutinoglossum americanum]